MSLPGGYQTWEIILLVILVAIGILAFILGYDELFAKAEEQTAFPKESNLSEVPGTPSFSSLGVDSADSADTIIYKLFKNFDPSFLSEKSGDKIYYNSFTVDMKGIAYTYSALTSKIDNGIKDFANPDYVIGSSAISCNVQQSSQINYNNDCWISSLDIEPNPCNIYYNGNTLDGKARIKVLWYLDGKIGDRNKVNVLVTLCDG
jgi:hypothetical protein